MDNRYLLAFLALIAAILTGVAIYMFLGETKSAEDANTTQELNSSILENIRFKSIKMNDDILVSHFTLLESVTPQQKEQLRSSVIKKSCDENYDDMMQGRAYQYIYHLEDDSVYLDVVVDSSKC
ncbi:MAG: hypothetical protein U9N49_00675 [Campylobacterota bacterium]|nr:hypothetical protein [Campylobacterota bacterium]